jgi:hypothetical protein
MSLEFPVQNRAIDPYSSYNSNVVNVLTRMITRGKNCLHGVHAIDVVIDATCSDTEIVILSGECFKDDVLIQILESKTVDMTIADYYLNHMNPWTEAGYYYVCLEYTYQKAKPAPEAKIRILKPSQRNLYDADTSPFLFLKCVEVNFNGSTFEVSELYDYDPSATDNKRIYSQLYAGVEDTLPTFDKIRDEGRLVYVHDQDELFFGISNRWEAFNAIRANIDTTLSEEGNLVYVDSSGFAQNAISTASDTLADGIVLHAGDSDGKIRLYGEFEGINIESGISIQAGDDLFLSSHEAGKVTNLIPTMYAQYIGVATSNSDLNNQCNLLFLPGRQGSGYEEGYENRNLDFYQDLLHSSIFEYLFVETFNNDDFIDLANSNITINNLGYFLTGGTGDVYQTISLQESSFTAQLHVAQITAKKDCIPAGNIKWYISNNGNEALDWEEAELDKLHYFSTYRLDFSSVTGIFQVGENVLSSNTNKMATINGINSGQILVFGDTRDGIDYQIGETITGQTSGAVGVISAVVNRQLSSYHDLRIKIEFEGSPNDCKIYDYGVLYDQDEDIFNTMPSEIDIQANIDTLYLDLYTYPSQDNDGNANLAVPIQTQIQDLHLFIDETCCTAIEQIENDITHITDGIDNDINTINNDINTLYQDIYETPHRDDDGLPNRTESIEETLNSLQTQINNLVSTIVRPAMFITTANTAPDVSPVPSIIRFDYSSNLTVTNFTNGVVGQEIVLVFTNNNTTIQHNSHIHLYGDTNFSSEAEDVLTLVYNGSIWIEKSRSSDIYI